MVISAPLQLFRDQIAAAIQNLWAIAPEQVRIDLAERHYAAHFSSPIAIAIAPQLRLNPLEIATKIAQSCRPNSQMQQWQIQAVGKGWLNITLAEDFILENLQQLLIWQPEHLVKQDNLWRRQDIATTIEHDYAYARCCALIRLATRENRESLDLLTFPNSQTTSQAISFPPDHVDPAELELCLEILAIADYLLTNSQNLPPEKRKQFKTSLSRKFRQFYDRCRIFGVSSAMVKRRLLLIAITQKLFLAIAPDAVDYAPYL